MRLIRLKTIAGGMLLLALGLFPAACQKTYTVGPVSPAQPASTLSATPTSTPTSVFTGSMTPTASLTASFTSTPTPPASSTFTHTPTMTSSPTFTPSNFFTFTQTATSTSTASFTATPASTGTSTPTATATVNLPLIEANIWEGEEAGTSPSCSVYAYVSDSSDDPVTTASVTFALPAAYGGPIPLPYLEVYTNAPPSNSGIAAINAGEYGVGLTNYPAGEPCTFTVTWNGITYTQAFTAEPLTGGFTDGATGVTFTWSGGNDDLVQVVGNDNFQEGPVPALTSPYVLPASDFPKDPAGAGNDFVGLSVIQLTSPAFPGSNPKSVVVDGLQYIGFY